MRTPLHRHAALLSLVAAAALVAVVMACWVALRPATSGRNSLPEPIRIAEVPGSSPSRSRPPPRRPTPVSVPVPVPRMSSRRRPCRTMTRTPTRTTRTTAGTAMTAREFALAETFLHHPGQVLAREQLLSHVWGYDVDPGSNVVDVYVRYLRRKLGAARIETVRGMGYRLVAD